ncbi:hypothetical protein CARUB_v10007487mg [Capsella rubella]|uniref:S-protein homolog n=1 Tax=Capsella rubella TaxID=81985 RepID=R0GPR6_9BRAS|nr:S-protein homolog 9 [Capsella rubella]EOA18864.1 hypothetical protein CARUB_v10007487mg [Capsella rubella]
MNRLLCFLLIIGLCVGLSDSFKFNEKNSVFFKSSLSRNNVLKIHCLSTDDLGVHFLRPGETYDFSFHDSFLTTSFGCFLWQGPNFKFQAEFEAYEGGGFIVHYGKKNYWDAREDGIYFTHGKEIPKLEYKWNLTTPDSAVQTNVAALF